MFRGGLRRRQKFKINTPKAGKPHVKVGFPADANIHTKNSDGVSVIEKAVFNHFGTSNGIPERPFLSLAIKENTEKYRAAIKKNAAPILRGDVDETVLLKKLGVVAQGDIQEKITSLRTPPNADQTIQRKGSSNPLIDTGEMRQSVTWRLA